MISKLAPICGHPILGLNIVSDTLVVERTFEKKSLSAPMIFDDMQVFAQLISASLPSESTRMASVSSMYLHAYDVRND